jgi:16S rRNA (cytosine1402-N4)-methyltransferase
MPEEVLEALAVKPGGVYVDGTLGGAGHATRIVQALTTGLLIGIDRDSAAIETAAERLRGMGPHAVYRGNFHRMDAIDDDRLRGVDGVLLDLGVSSYQLDTAERGFSYRLDGRLDMRMDDRDPLTAYEVVNRYSEKQLADIIFAYGEDRFAKRIARAIMAARPVETTLQLAALVEDAVPLTPRAGAGHPAKRVFQAIRIEVNSELKGLDEALRNIVKRLKPGGRICVITFHSLEDRIVKQCFKSLANPCTCPRDIPYCVCKKTPELKIITRKPVLPGEAEIQDNPRAHSAKLRAAEKI